MQEMQETRIWSLDWEEPLEREMATHSSIPAWKIPWTTVHGVAKSQTWLSADARTHTSKLYNIHKYKNTVYIEQYIFIDVNR